MPGRRRRPVAATAGAKNATLGMCMGTVVPCVRTAVARRRARAPSPRFDRRLGLRRRRHDDFYLSIAIEDILRLDKSRYVNQKKPSARRFSTARTRAKLERDGARGGLENR